MPKSVIAMIGDLADSRSYPDQPALLRSVQEALSDHADLPGTSQPPRLIIGDEFQGVYRDLPSALAATIRIRNALHLVDVQGRPLVARVGLGVGEVIAPGGPDEPQSGDAWWSARSAIEHVETALAPPWFTWIEGSEAMNGVVRGLVMLLDQVMGEWDTIDHVIFRGRISTKTQTEIGEQVGLEQSAVSKRIAGHDIGAVLKILAELET